MLSKLMFTGGQRLSLTIGSNGDFYGYSVNKHGVLTPPSLTYRGATYTIKEFYTYLAGNFTSILFTTNPPFSIIVAEIKGSRYIFNCLDDGDSSHKNIFRVYNQRLFTKSDTNNTYEIVIHSIH